MQKISPRKRKVLLWSAGVALVIMAGLHGAGVAIRSEIEEYAAKRGAFIEFEDMSVGWFNLELSNVRARRGADPELEAELREVTIGLSPGFRPKTVTVRGGSIKMKEGSRQEEGDERSVPGPDVSVENLTVHWSGNGTSAEVEGLDVRRESGVISGSARTAVVTGKNLRVEAEDVQIQKEEAVSVKARRVVIKKVVSETSGPTEKSDGAFPSLPGVPFDMDASIEALEIEGPHDLQVQARGVKASVKEGKDPTYEVEAEGLTFGKAAAETVKAKVGWDGKSGRMVVSAGNVSNDNEHVTSRRMNTGPVSAVVDVFTSQPAFMTSTVKVGKTEVNVEIWTDGSGDMSTKVVLPDQECQDVIESVPAEMRSEIEGIKMDGKIGFDLGVKMSDRSDPAVNLRLRNLCRVKDLPTKADLVGMARPFQVPPAGTSKEASPYKTGPGTEQWTNIELVSQFMPLAVMATEDPGFQSHHGFSVKAIENSLALDLKEKKFSRGASTISMQLAKNLWLGGKKTASRKFQEAVLTMCLEQRLPKDKIMELYLNVVEFAPGVRGVRNGARYWFSTDPGNLSLPQAILLALQLPNPKASPFGPDGGVTPSRMKIVRAVIAGMRGAGTISENEMKDALREEPSRGKAKTPSEEAEETDVTGWE